MNWLRANRLSVKDPLASRSNQSNMGSSVDTKMKNSKNIDFMSPGKIRSNPSFSLERVNSKTIESTKASLSSVFKHKDQVKLPSLKKNEQPQEFNPESTINQVFYQTQIYRSFNTYDTNYMMSLARQHFHQTIDALRITKNLRVVHPKKQIKLERKSLHKKTVYLDLDQTLIHTDERSQSYTIKLTFPIDNGGKIQAAVRIRPFCHQFLKQLAKFAQIIIFTASSPSYANVILDHLDPHNKIFAHRLYRQHCTLEKGFYVKDLRVVNRNLEDVVIVDNSAFSFTLQPQNGIPILPYYHFNKDRELQTLIVYLKQVVQAEDCRKVVKKTFFWDLYLKDHSDPKKIFMRKYKKNSQEKYIN